MYITAPITSVKGIGEKTAQTFEKLNIHTVEDVLFHFPRNYFRYPEAIQVNEIEVLQEGMIAIRAIVKKTPVSRNARSMNVTTLVIGEAPKQLQLVWFRMPYVKNSLEFGHEYVFYGKMVIKNKRWTMEQPTIYEVGKYQSMEGLLQPVYGLTAGITNNLITKTVKTILSDMELIHK